MSWRWLRLLAVGVLAGPGCFRATHLVYVYDVDVGVDVAASLEGGSGKLVVGYDRNTFALVPQREDTATISCPADGHGAVEGASSLDPTAAIQTSVPSQGELMSLVAVSDVSIKGLNTFEFNHVITTGQAAAKIVKDKDMIELLRKAIYGTTGGQ